MDEFASFLCALALALFLTSPVWLRMARTWLTLRSLARVELEARRIMSRGGEHDFRD